MDTSKHSIDWQEGSWTREPISVTTENNKLIVEAAEGSDYWQKTVYGFEHDNGHALLTPWNPDFAMEVTFRLENFSTLFDQAGLMLWHTPVQWIKTGVELSDGLLCIGAVVSDEYSDWSLFPIPAEWAGQDLTMRASLLNDGVVIRARIQNSPWQTIRVARFPYRNDLKAGPFVSAPGGQGFVTTFTSWQLSTPDADIHKAPPI